MRNWTNTVPWKGGYLGAPESLVPAPQDVFVPNKVVHERSTGIPGVIRVHAGHREDIKQVLDIRILRCDPLRFFIPGLSGSNVDRQAGEVMVLGCAEEWR